jgi:hypothetical protein
LLLLAVVTGCGQARAKVSGRVLYNGEPLPGGRVTFRPADSKENAVTSPVDPQGNYEAELPVGDVKVSIENLFLQQRAPLMGAGPPRDLPLSVEARQNLGEPKLDQSQPNAGAGSVAKQAGTYVPIPSKYANGDTSELDFTVRSGEQRHDIELKD